MFCVFSVWDFQRPRSWLTGLNFGRRHKKKRREGATEVEKGFGATAVCERPLPVRSGSQIDLVPSFFPVLTVKVLVIFYVAEYWCIWKAVLTLNYQISCFYWKQSYFCFIRIWHWIFLYFCQIHRAHLNLGVVMSVFQGGLHCEQCCTPVLLWS